MEGYIAPDEGVGSVKCAKLAWTVDQLADSACPWGLPTFAAGLEAASLAAVLFAVELAERKTVVAAVAAAVWIDRTSL